MAAAGFPKQSARSRRGVPVTSALPAAEVFRTGSPRFLDSAAAIAAAAPTFSRDRGGGDRVASARRSRSDDRLIEFCFSERRAFDEHDRELLTRDR